MSVTWSIGEPSHPAGVQLIHGAGDDDFAALDSVRERGRLAQHAYRLAHVRFDSAVNLFGGLESGRHARECGLDLLEQRLNVRRLVLAVSLGPERRGHRAARFVAEHEHELHAEMVGGVLDAAQFVQRGHVAGDADHEQVSEALVEQGLERNARITAAENRGEGMLRAAEFGAPNGAGVWMLRVAGDESLVAGLEPRSGLGGRHRWRRGTVVGRKRRMTTRYRR